MKMCCIDTKSHGIPVNFQKCDGLTEVGDISYGFVLLKKNYYTK